MKKLLIDIPELMKANLSAEEIKCEYFYHRENAGGLSLMEVAEFAVYCRQCKEAFCVTVCPKDALEHRDDGLIVKHNMRCVGCKSCTLACPFGTIFPEVMNYITSKCDLCLKKLEKDPDYIPLCVSSTPEKILEMREIEAENPRESLFFYGDHIAIKANDWRYKEDKR
ncbi:MAG: 4Fe-4S dicluster domain-containing protein [Fidelibacterota bacterium]